MNGSASAPSSETMNGTRCAIRFAMKATAQAVQLCHHHRGVRLAGLRKRLAQHGAPIEGVGAPAEA